MTDLAAVILGLCVIIGILAGLCAWLLVSVHRINRLPVRRNPGDEYGSPMNRGKE